MFRRGSLSLIRRRGAPVEEKHTRVVIRRRAPVVLLRRLRKVRGGNVPVSEVPGVPVLRAEPADARDPRGESSPFGSLRARRRPFRFQTSRAPASRRRTRTARESFVLFFSAREKCRGRLAKIASRLDVIHDAPVDVIHDGGEHRLGRALAPRRRGFGSASTGSPREDILRGSETKHRASIVQEFDVPQDHPLGVGPVPAEKRARVYAPGWGFGV